MSSQKQKKSGAENRQAKKRRLLEENAKKCKSLNNFFASDISPGADDGMGVTSGLLDYPPVEPPSAPAVPMAQGTRRTPNSTPADTDRAVASGGGGWGGASPP